MNGLVLPPTVTVTDTGLDIPRGISKDQWEELGATLGQFDRKIQWMVGDWINAGEREGYIDRDTYDAAERLFPQLSRATLHTYASVARNSLTRVKELSFDHHRAVAPLPANEQTERLAEARNNGWSVSELRQQIKQETAEAAPVQCCPTCGHKLPRGIQVRMPQPRRETT